MIRRPPRSTQSRSSAASDVYKRQIHPVPVLADTRSVVEGKFCRNDRPAEPNAGKAYVLGKGIDFYSDFASAIYFEYGTGKVLVAYVACVGGVEQDNRTVFPCKIDEGLKLRPGRDGPGGVVG